MSSVHLLVGAGHEVLRNGVRAILEDNPDWNVVAEANDGRQTIEKAIEFRPDAILDFDIPATDGLDAARGDHQEPAGNKGTDS